MNRGLRLPVFLSMYSMSTLKIKRLTLQYAYLTAEKEEVHHICQSVEKEIRQYFEEKHPAYYKKIFSQPKQEIKKDVEDINSTTKKSKDLKKLYRKIASKTHPDKTSKKEHRDIFLKAAKAYRENDLGKILEISGSLNLELLELSNESINLLEKNIKTISKNLSNMKQTVAWGWHNATSDEDKTSLIEAILKDKGINYEA
jgi:hypothetical protein